MKQQVIGMNQGWQFHLGDVPNAWQKWHETPDWREVDLPHDWSVEHPFSKEHSSGTGYLPGGTAWYRKRFTLPESDSGKRVFVSFEGVYRNSEVWCNSYFLGKRPYGYIPFLYEITEQVNFGSEDNLIAVRVEHEEIADSRWFTGSGITREVHVFVADPVYIPHEGVFFHTKSLSNIDNTAAVATADAVLGLAVEVKNDTTEEQKAKLDVSLVYGDHVLEHSADVLLAAGEETVVDLELELQTAVLWSELNPALYDLSVTLTSGDYTDEAVLRVGVRDFAFDPDSGFRLNGRSLKMKGVCVHHDAGTLGAAVPKVVWERRLRKLIEMGANAVRCSHNPHDPGLYELCDELGLFVIDEIYDEWEGPKNKWSTGHNVYPPKHQGNYKDFPAWHEQDVANWIRRGRSHASIFTWSMGNEIDYPNDPYCHPLFQEMTGNNDANKPKAERMYNPDKPNAERLTVLAKKLYDVAKKEDPTRPITVAAAFPELSSHIGFTEVFDLIGYNYKEQFYEEDHKRFPDKPFYGSENGHEYEFWRAVTDNDYIFGQFLWTGIDFMGEAHGWPIRGSEAGLLTMAGFPKEEFYYRQSLWSDQPVLHISTAVPAYTAEGRRKPILRTWSYGEGQTIEVFCYTNFPKAELFLNGKSLGEKAFCEKNGYISWDVPYEAGELQVKAVDEAGQTHVDTLRTQASAVAVELSTFESRFYEDDRVIQVEVFAVDQDGEVVSTDNTKLEVRVEGPATLMGIETGDVSDLTAYNTNYRNSYRGKMIVYLRKHADASSPVTLTVGGVSIKPASLSL